MLEHLDNVPWKDLEHAYGSAEDVPDLLRKLLDPDPKVRSDGIWTLFGNVFHQGTRYPATPYVVPFLIELCEREEVPSRIDLLRFWGSLITGYFSVQERPCWGDGKQIHYYGEILTDQNDEPYAAALHRIYEESLRGREVLYRLISSDDDAVRSGAAWVLACLPTIAEQSIAVLEVQLRSEPNGWVRASIAFALGELGAAAPLQELLASDSCPAARCMAACELARIEPGDQLVESLLHYLSEPIEEYENVPGAGGKSTGDAAFAITQLPSEIQRRAIPALCDRLDAARSFDTMPFVRALLSAAFQPTDQPLTELSTLQRQVLIRMVNSDELWSIGNLFGTFRAHGLPEGREKVAELIGVKVNRNKALESLSSGVLFSEIGFLEKARGHFEEALELDPVVFERAPSPDESWLFCAKAFAETDPERALLSFHRAAAINPRIAHRIDPKWVLADLLHENGLR